MVTVVDSERGRPTVSSVTRTELFEALRGAEVRQPVSAGDLKAEQEGPASCSQDEVSVASAFEQVLASEQVEDNQTRQKEEPGRFAPGSSIVSVVLRWRVWWRRGDLNP